MKPVITNLIVLKPDIVGWTENLKVKTFNMDVVGTPEMSGGKIINGAFSVKDINVISSSIVTLNVTARFSATTYLALKQKINKLHYTILNNVQYTLDLYFYDPDNSNGSGKLMYDSTNFPVASYMVPFSNPLNFKWLLTNANEIEDGKSNEAKLMKINNQYYKDIKLVFRSKRFI